MKALHLFLVLVLACGIGRAAEVRYYDVPDGAHPHDVAPDPRAGGPVWYTAQRQGALGRLDPATASGKAWRSWKLPGDKPQAYSVWVDEDDKVWLTDFVANAIVRFDPQTATFESFPSDAPKAAVRQMLGRKGEAWGAESGADRLVVIRH